MREEGVEALCAEVEAELRGAEGAGYDERHNRLTRASWAVRRLCRGLTVKGARAARGTFLAVVDMPEIGGCAPACCNASYVRMEILGAKNRVLRAWAGKDPAVAAELTREQVERLLAPYSTRIALATAELFALSPRGTALHLDTLLDVVRTHPRWQVQWALVRALGRAELRGRTPRRVVDALQRAVKSEHPEVERAAKKALATQQRREEASSEAAGAGPR